MQCTYMYTIYMYLYTTYIHIGSLTNQLDSWQKMTFSSGEYTLCEYFVRGRLMRVLYVPYTMRIIYIIRKTFIHIYYSITRIIKCPGKWYMIYILFRFMQATQQTKITSGTNTILLSTILTSFVSSHPSRLAQFDTMKARVDVIKYIRKTT